MYNQQIYYSNARPQVRIYQQPNLNPYSTRSAMQQPPSQPQAQKITVNAIQGFLIQNQYQPQIGDPIVVQQAVFRGQVVKVGNKNKQVINQNAALLAGEGYASQDGNMWKHLPKIMMDIFKIGQLQINKITKLKARYQPSLAQHKVMKITYNQVDHYLAFKEKDFNQWFLRIVWARLILDKRETAQFGNWENEVTGSIYKKSQILGEWQPRVVVIDSRSLRSSKDNKSSVSLEINGTKQIWTRFQEIRGGYFLVIKLWYGIIKEEFAVPTAFCLKWLYHFLGLLVLK